MDISERIKTKRTELQLTQEELAKKVGVSFQAISKWENGKSLPDIEILPVLSKVLNESIDFLLTGQEFKKKEEPEKDEIVAYFESFIKPYTLTESGIRSLRQAARDYPIEKVKECICIAFDTYGRNKGEIQKSQVSEMLDKLGGILYNESLPPVQRRIVKMVSSLSKRVGSHNQRAGRQLKKDIANLLSWKTVAGDRKDENQQIAILNEINETHLSSAKSLWAAHYSIEEEIDLYVQAREDKRRKRAFCERIIRGFISIDEECPSQVQEQINVFNEEFKKGPKGIPEKMNLIISTLGLEMLALSELQDEFLVDALERRDFRSLAPKMYDYLGRYLGKYEYGNLLQMIETVDAIISGVQKLTVETLDAFQSLLNHLLKKWLVLQNKKERRKQDNPS